MSPGEWAAIVGVAITSIGAAHSSMKFMVKAIMREIGPLANGDSLKAQVNRLERRFEALELRLDRAIERE